MEEIKTMDSQSCKEIYVILNKLGLFYKLPEKLREYIAENQSLSHEYDFDANLPLFYQIDNEKTKAYISYIYLKYINDNEEEKILLLNEYEQNEKLRQEELMKKYNPDDIFKNKNNMDTEIKEEAVEVTNYKKSTWLKIIEKIKKFFGLK